MNHWRHLVLCERAELPVVSLKSAVIPAHWESDRILHRGIEIQVLSSKRQRRFLEVRDVPAVRVCLTNDPRRAPDRRLPNVLMFAAPIGRRVGISQRLPPRMKSSPSVEVVVSQSSTAMPCAGSPYQLLRSKGTTPSGSMPYVGEVVSAHLPAVVRQSVRIGLGLRQQAACARFHRYSPRSSTTPPAENSWPPFT